MALEMRAYIEGCRGHLPPRDERYRVGELVRLVFRDTPPTSASRSGTSRSITSAAR